jgi:hypothetical protein
MKKLKLYFIGTNNFPKLKKANFATKWRSKNQLQAECIIEIKENTRILMTWPRRDPA